VSRRLRRVSRIAATLSGPKRARTLADYSSGRDNNFDALRLFAAGLVLFSHSFALVGRGEPKLGATSLGVVGVEIFFAISGYLVVKSWLSQPRLVAFLVKRSLRILPALIVTLIASAYVLGPLVTDVGWRNYFFSTAPLHHVVDTLIAVATAGVVGHIDYFLPHVFAGNPHSAVNGSLWTLPVEVRAYYLLAFLGMLGLLLRWLPAVAGAALLAVAWISVGAGWPGVGPIAERLAGQQEMLMLLAIFMTSALLYLKRERIVLSTPIAALAAIAWLTLAWTDIGPAVAIITVPYVALFLAYRSGTRVRAITRHGDMSYGVYLLAFPVQQVVVLVAGVGLGPWGVAAVSLPLTYGLAFVSWRLVEAPALRLKRYVLRAHHGMRREELVEEPVQAAPALP
jgi:peptidoglycan/LPS O-acetylase OafA/YrhL